MQRMDQIAQLVDKPWHAAAVGAALPDAFMSWVAAFEALEDWGVQRGGSDLTTAMSSSAVFRVNVGSWRVACCALPIAP